MTALYMEGFETVIDSIDLQARGWRTMAVPMQNAVNTSGMYGMSLPSRSGMAGKGLYLKGPYNSNATTLPFTGQPDFGMLDTGQSIYSLWQAGGFVLGCNATFNKGSYTAVAHYTPHQICYDGSQYYWAICQSNTAAWFICYSTDLQNWTPCSAAPANMATTSTISVYGSGSSATVMVGYLQGSPGAYYYYSTNMGVTWSTTGTTGINSVKKPIATGNATTPIAMTGVPGSGTIGVFYQTALSATPTQVAGLGMIAINTYNYGFAKLVNGIAVFGATAGTIASTGIPVASPTVLACCPVSKDMTASANYTLSATLAGHELTDITFLNNTWIAVGHGGIFTAPNSGTVGSPAGPTAAWTTALSVTSNGGVYAIDTNGTIAVAVGNDNVYTNMPAIYTSTDGVTWSKQNRFTWSSTNAAANQQPFTNVIWDGHQFVLTGGVNNNLIATSPDGIAWTGVYYPDYAEQAATACASMLGVYSGTVLAGQYVDNGQGGVGTYSPFTTSSSYVCGIGLATGVVSGSTRAVQVATVPSGTSVSTVGLQAGTLQAVPVNPLTHFYEIIATSVPGNTNQFTFKLAVDGIVGAVQVGPVAFALPTDTAGTAHLLINLPRSGVFVMIDDLYLTNMSGTNNVGQLGPTNVVPFAPSSDSTTQFSRSAGSSNAGAVAGPYSNSESYAYTGGVGNKDVYNTNASVPAGYRVRAVQAEGFFAKNGATGATATVGMVSGSTELDSAQVSAVSATPVYATVLSETDPATGAAWTNAAAQAIKIAIAKAT